MPPLFESMFVESVKTRFRTFNITLPSQVSTGRPANLSQFLVQPQTTLATGSSLVQSVTISGTISGLPKLSTTTTTRPTGTPLSFPPALFRAASNDKADTDFQSEANNEFNNYINNICHAIVGAHDNWRYTAFLRGVQVNAIVASGGSITGPSLSTNISMYGPQSGLWGNAPAYTRAIADGFGTCWSDWQQTVRVPNLPWYPMFATLPMAAAPPTPNVPTPLAMLQWSPTPLLPDTIAGTISRKLGVAGPYSNELFTSLATGFAAALAMWFPIQMVMNVIGRGPVPTFAPPYVPVGPVVGGNIVEASPHFST